MLIAVAATAAAHWAPVVGAPVLGILAGVVVSASLRSKKALGQGLGLASSRGLQVAVVLLGTQLSLRQVWDVGTESLPVMIGTLAACLLVAAWAGRALGIGCDLRTLVGVGTGICGASAIAAVSPVIKAKGDDIAYAITTIFLFNVAAVLAFPPVGHALGLSQHAFGLFAGTAVNDTSSVVAAASTYGDQASNYAVVVKLTRTLMIIPISLALAAATRRRRVSDTGDSAGRTRPRLMQLVPAFLVGFLICAAANTAGVIPDGAHRLLRDAATLLITTALAAIGLSTNVERLRTAGFRPLLLGLVLWLTVAAASLLIQLATSVA